MKTVACSQLKPGMFVAELDRPWLETPFLIQGFLIEDEEQLAQLQHYCKHVKVDPAHSVGEFYDAPDRSRPPPPSPRAAIPIQVEDFIDVVRAIRGRSLTRLSETPKVDPHDKRSRLEDELRYSAQIIDDVHSCLKALSESIRADRPIDLAHIARHISEIAEGVARNPEAILWLTRLKTTDEYSYDHALDVSVHLMVFARFLGLSNYQVECLGIAGLMQDVGKTHLPPEILRKPGPLTPEEYTQAQSHVASSLEILVPQPDLPPDLLEIIARHHERLDGSGYPSQLMGETIGLLAELAGLMDTYCAMIRQRPYNRPVSNQQAMAELVQMRAKKFREALVDQFIQCMGLYPIGTLVELNSGEVAVVLQQNQVRRLQPRVLILLAPDKSMERYPRTVNLILEPRAPTGDVYRILRALPENAYGIDPGEYYLV